eukprot:CAMPEP_0202968184 /NCGR_PEP_ID=MMETSP1396-20130829/13370_1 /ASSEMBLY_ACC=CAM_ASM_000872 /TAXON_ID= /ORGANISM="Pseudokeronopsis sp., Strain Brazil" /LENGTH=73 /DNA_ID=CAMNT_0049694195 /DNA_START=394 /DNA_END=615 /DNA_ORIENTATION=+
MADLIKNINKQKAKAEVGIKEKLGTTQIVTKRDASYFSQNRIEEIGNKLEGEEQEEEEYRPYDEREQGKKAHK